MHRDDIPYAYWFYGSQKQKINKCGSKIKTFPTKAVKASFFSGSISSRLRPIFSGLKSNMDILPAQNIRRILWTNGYGFF